MIRRRTQANAVRWSSSEKRYSIWVPCTKDQRAVFIGVSDPWYLIDISSERIPVVYLRIEKERWRAILAQGYGKFFPQRVGNAVYAVTSTPKGIVRLQSILYPKARRVSARKGTQATTKAKRLSAQKGRKKTPLILDYRECNLKVIPRNRQKTAQ